MNQAKEKSNGVHGAAQTFNSIVWLLWSAEDKRKTTRP
jgi:hypothetical protein